MIHTQQRNSRRPKQAKTTQSAAPQSCPPFLKADCCAESENGVKKDFIVTTKRPIHVDDTDLLQVNVVLNVHRNLKAY